jgi:NTE family protein
MSTRDTKLANQLVSARRHLVLGAVAGLGLGVAGPASSAPKNPGGKAVKYPEVKSACPKLAVVLGGGSARGFAHVGVIKALEAAGIHPDLIIGCSAGALVGAFWAAGHSGEEMETLAYQVRDEDVIDLAAGTAGSRRGLVSGNALQNFVNRVLGDRSIENLLTPFVAVATRYPLGELQEFTNGNLGFAVRASCSIPGVFMPAANASGQEFLDGGLISPLPIESARMRGASLVIAIDIAGADPGESRDASHGLYQLLLRSFDIMGDSLRRQQAVAADVVIRPSVSRIVSTDMSARHALIEAGFVAGRRLAPVVLEKLKNNKA